MEYRTCRTRGEACLLNDEYMLVCADHDPLFENLPESADCPRT
jgi:hypothetical protein